MHVAISLLIIFSPHWASAATQASGAVPSLEPVISSKPKVVSTLPSVGATVAPGDLTIQVTFDRAMDESGYAFVTNPQQGAFPQCEGTPLFSQDKRTVSWRCRVESNRSYVVWVNSPPYMGFISAADVAAATPFQLHFKTGK